MIVDPRWSRRESEEAWKRAAQTLAEDLRVMTRERDEARAERDALIGAGCSVEQNALALLDLYAERERHATTERDAARAEVSRAEYERDLVRAEIDRRTDWYQQRFQTLREWVNNYVRPISEEAYQRYWNIVANGSPAPHERSDWTLTMHGLTLRAERAEKERDEARAELEQLVAKASSYNTKENPC